MSDIEQETITLDAVARRLALTPEQVRQARALLGGQDEANVQLVLAVCRQVLREAPAPAREPLHAMNARLIGDIVAAEREDEQRAA
jgi:hypothetical protein